MTAKNGLGKVPRGKRPSFQAPTASCMQCTKCHVKLDPGDRFCGECGQAVQAVTASPRAEVATTPVLGLDLGISYSLVAAMVAGKPFIVPNAEGARSTPNVVGFGNQNARYVGAAAKSNAAAYPTRTFSSFRRKAYKDAPAAEVDGKKYSNEELWAMVIGKIKADAELYLGQKVKGAVFTVPGYFDYNQRAGVRNAVELAGFSLLRMVSESVSSALNYEFTRNNKADDETILVYSLGGGNFEASIVEIGAGVVEVKATAGECLGGDDFDERLMNFIADDFQREQGIDLRQDPQASQRLREASEKAKIELSFRTQTEIDLPYIVTGPDRAQHLKRAVMRAQFEELTRDLLQRTRTVLDRMVADINLLAQRADRKEGRAPRAVYLTPGSIDKVVLVGGSTRMPAVPEMIKQWTGKEPYRGLNADEAAAIGTAVVAVLLSGQVQDCLLLEVTPLSLGVETSGGVFTKVIERYTTTPCRNTETFMTCADSQTTVQIRIRQGDQPLAANNKLLGSIIMSGIPPAPRGVSQVEVTFDVDANGMLRVAAEHKPTGKQQSLVFDGRLQAGFEEEAQTALNPDQAIQLKQ